MWIQFVLIFFAWVAGELMYPAAMTWAPNNKVHQTLSVAMEASIYWLGEYPISPCAVTVLWYPPVGLRKELARVSNGLIVYI